MTFLFDTSVYLDLLQSREQLETWRALLTDILPRTWLSSVVLHDLLAGARGDVGRAAVLKALGTLERVGRTVAPTHHDWREAARVRGRIWEEHPTLRSKALQNDLLIATSARRIGAYLVTANVRDFKLIKRYLPLRFGTLEQLTP